VPKHPFGVHPPSSQSVRRVLFYPQHLSSSQTFLLVKATECLPDRYKKRLRRGLIRALSFTPQTSKFCSLTPEDSPRPGRARPSAVPQGLTRNEPGFSRWGGVSANAFTDVEERRLQRKAHTTQPGFSREADCFFLWRCSGPSVHWPATGQAATGTMPRLAARWPIPER